MSHRLALPAGFDLEGCRIESILGKGGFGLTYLAVDTALDMKVAVKELLPDGIATRVRGTTVEAQTEDLTDSWEWALRRFEEEARTLARLRHPNIVRVLRLARAHGTAYMIMEYVEGVSLAEWLREHPRPAEQELKDLLLPLLDGLEYVHDNQLLHRDISPENIFITKDGRPVLLDFGSARQDLGKTMSVTAVVRHGYSPFEQYQVKSRQGPFSDLYALAGVMVAAMTGQKPPPATDRISEESQDEPLSRQCRGRYSEAFCRAIESAFAVRAQDRPQTVAEFRRLLGGGQPAGGSKAGGKRGGGETTVVVSTGRTRGALWIPAGLFGCVGVAVAGWWFGVALPERQEQARERERQQLAAIADLERQKAEALQAVAAATREREEAEARAREARQQEAAAAAMQQRLEEDRRRKEEEARDEARRQRLAQEKMEEEQRLAEQRRQQQEQEAKQQKIDALGTLVSNYMASLRADSLNLYSQLFADYVDYIYWRKEGKSGLAPRSFVEQDRRAYLREYTQRSYQMLDNGTFHYTLQGDQNQASVSFGYSYNVSGSKKAASGRSQVRLQVRWTGSKWIINSFDETVTRNR